MASGTATTAPSTATMAPSTAPLPLTAGPRTIVLSPIVPIVAPLGAQDTPSVIQRARLVVSTEQTMQSTPGYGTLPYCRIREPCRTLPCLLCQQGLLTQWVIMVRAISSLLCLTLIGCLWGSKCYNISSFRNGSSLKLGELAKPSLSLSPPFFGASNLRLRTMLRSFQWGQAVLRGLDLKTRLWIAPLNVPSLLQHLADPSLPEGTTLEGLAQPQGHLRPVLNGLRTDCSCPGLGSS